MNHHDCQAVLFDLDGTLLDTAPDFITAVNRLLHERQHKPLPGSKIRAGVTHGTAGLVTLAFGFDPSHPDFEPTRQALLGHYRQCLTEQTDLFPGMKGVLIELASRHIPWGIVTNKPELYTQAILQELHFPTRPAVVVCPDHVTRTKPDPEPMLLACHQLGVAPDQCIYVGDHLRDILAGKNAGTITVAAAYGYLDDDEDPWGWGADHVIGTPDELLALLF